MNSTSKRKVDEAGSGNYSPADDYDCNEASKRSKSAAAPAEPDGEDDEKDLHLPAPVWGSILNYLPYKDVRTSLLVCKTIANDAVNYVQTLNIFRGSELCIRASQKRFAPNATSVNIYCFLDTSSSTRDTLAQECMWQIVPFLSSFPKLKNVYLGGYDQQRGFSIDYYCYSAAFGGVDEEEALLYLNFVDSLLGAFQAGALPSNLKSLEGVMVSYRMLRPCKRRRESPDKPCFRCRRICQFMPLNSNAMAQQRELCVSLFDRFAIFNSRPGGDKYVQKYAQKALIGCFISDEARGYHSPSRSLRESPYWQSVLARLEDGIPTSSLPIQYIEDSAFEELDRLLGLGIIPAERTPKSVFGMLFAAGAGPIWAKSTMDKMEARGLPTTREVEAYNIQLLDDRNEPLLRELRDHMDGNDSDEESDVVLVESDDEE